MRLASQLQSLSNELGHEVVAEATDGHSGMVAIIQTMPDLVLLDYGLPGLDGIEVLGQARRRVRFESKVIVVSAGCSPRMVHRVSAARVNGFLDMSSQRIEDVRAAIAAVAEGGLSFAEPFRHAYSRLRTDPESFDKILTRQELRVVELIGEIAADSEISTRLALKRRTLAWHLQNIMGKLGVHSRVELIRWAKENGFLAE